MTATVTIKANKGHRVTVRNTTDGETTDVVTVEPGDAKDIDVQPGAKTAFTIEAENTAREGLANPASPFITSDLPAGDYGKDPEPVADSTGPATDLPAGELNEPMGMGEPKPVKKGTITAKEPLGAAKAQPKASGNKTKAAPAKVTAKAKK